MTLLAKALRVDSQLQEKVHPGIGAIANKDRGLVAAADRQKIGDSIDLDTAMSIEHPQDNRWDYLLSVPSKSKLIAVEPHSATDGEISVVIKKKRNAQQYLRDHLKPTSHVSEWHWITRGRVAFSNMEKARRALDQNGIRFDGHVLKQL